MVPDHNWPTGAVTFLFSDIEDSTSLWDRHRAAMGPGLAAHDRLLQTAVSANNGVIVKTTGDGMMAAFSSPAAALAAAIEAQRALQEAQWATITPDRIRVRMGLHTGEAELRAGDYFGTAVNRAARIMAAGHGGQVLLSRTTARFIEDNLPAGITFRDLGEHHLKGLSRPVYIYQARAQGLPGDFPPLRVIGVSRGNLPQRPTSFIGRDRELAEVQDRLKEARLLTLTGPGGTGKTRLSLEAAFLIQVQYEHGAWFVELAPLGDPDQVAATVAGVFGLGSQTGGEYQEMLGDYLREKETLLILDNCEHLVAACARLAADLIAICPRLTILASSREGLGVYGETTYHLPTLSLPRQNMPGGTGISAASAGQSEAVQLFVERATAVQPGFQLDDANAAAVVQIVRRLDGIPLAIELAAARLRAFSVEQVAARLDNRFRLLTGGSRTALPRQQTLRALIDWSYDLLDEEERELFRRLSVFRGGWTFEAAEYMAELETGFFPEETTGSLETRFLEEENGIADRVRKETGFLEVYELLPQLVSKSLVTREEEPAPEAVEPRYFYLETIRQYAGDRLAESGRVEEVRDRHFAYYEALAETADFGAASGTDRLRGKQAFLEFDNLRAAIEWGLDRYPERVLNLFWNLSFYLSNQLPGTEFIGWSITALQRLEALPPAQGAAAEERELVRQKGLVILGMLYMFLGQLDDAKRVAVELLEILRDSDADPILMGMALFVRAQTAYFFEDPDLADLIDESIARARAMDDQPVKQSMLAMALMLSAIMEVRDGSEALAEKRFREVISILQGSSSYFLPWARYSMLVMMTQMDSQTEEVRAQYEKAIVELRQLGSRRLAGMAESDWAHRLRHNGEINEALLDEALAIYRRMLTEWREMGHRAAMANILENIAFIDRVQGQPQRAATFFGAAEHIREEIGQDMLRHEREEYERELAALKKMLDEGELQGLWAQGRALSTDALIDLAWEG